MRSLMHLCESEAGPSRPLLAGIQQLCGRRAPSVAASGGFGVFALGVALALLLAGGPVRGQSEPVPGHRISGMWVWSAEAYKTDEAQTRLLKFCRRHQFNHLDVHVRIDEQDGRTSLTEQKELAELLARAAEAKVSVCALRGSQRMFFESSYSRTLRELGAILEFNRRLPAGSRLAGIKYDVEPQTLAEWRDGGPNRERIMRDYLGCLAKIKAALEAGAPKGSKLELSVDIPFWWDKEELKLEYSGQTKLFSQQVQDLTDSITVMSYRRDAAAVKQLVQNEKEYATRTGKRVLPGLLHSKAADPNEAFLSFYGLPTAEYLRVRGELEQWASGQPGIGGVMHHHYGSLRGSLDATAPQARR